MAAFVWNASLRDTEHYGEKFKAGPAIDLEQAIAQVASNSDVLLKAKVAKVLREEGLLDDLKGQGTECSRNF